MSNGDTQHKVLELGEDLAVARLVRHAGAGPTPPADMTARVRRAAHDEWLKVVARRRNARRGRRLIGIAAALVLTSVTALLVLQPGQAPATAVARVTAVTGGFRISGEQRDAAAAPATDVYAGERLATASVGRAALSLPGGLSLRLDHDTSIRFESQESLVLERGGLYVDAGAGPGSPRLDVATALGTVRHVGTQYMVLTGEGQTRVLVREGKVSVRGPQGENHASAGQALLLAAGQAPQYAEVTSYGEQWAWADELAGGFLIEGRTLDEFLAWAARQTGRKLHYADASTRDLAGQTVLRGSVEDLPVEQAIEAVMATTSLAAQAEDGVLRVQSAGR